MKINAQTLENTYYKWLKQDLTFTDLEENVVAISTPFIDSEFDTINLYAEILGDKIKVTDFGYTVFNLEASGVMITKRSRTKHSIFTDIINTFGVQKQGDVLSITTDMDKFAIAKNRLLQAIMKINDLEFLSNHNINTAFNDLTQELLEKDDILFTRSVEIARASGVSSYFDFAIPNNKKGEQLVKTISRPNELNQAKAFNFDVQSVSQLRPKSKFVYLVDDVRKPITVKSSIKDTITSNLNEEIVSLIPYSTLVDKNDVLVNA